MIEIYEIIFMNLILKIFNNNRFDGGYWNLIFWLKKSFVYKSLFGNLWR